MADPSKTATPAKGPVLLPQGEHAGKPGLPLGQRLFTLIGSRNRAHLHLLSSTISRNHACIVYGKDGVYIRDLASRSGILINGRRVREADLHEDDLLQVGSFSFKFQEPPGTIGLATAPQAPLAMLEMDHRTLTPLDGRTVLIGRRHSCDIPLDFADVSSTHTIIFESDGRRFVRDLGSRSGTLVNGAAVHQQVLEFGDEIRVGATTFRYIAADATAHHADASPALELEPDLGELDADDEDLAPIGLDFEDTAAGHDLAPAPMIDDAPVAIPGLDASEIHSPAPAPLDLPEDAPGASSVSAKVAPIEDDATTWPEAVEGDPDLGLDFWAPQATPGIVPDSQHPAAPEEDHAQPAHEPAGPTLAEDQELAALDFLNESSSIGQTPLELAGAWSDRAEPNFGESVAPSIDKPAGEFASQSSPEHADIDVTDARRSQETSLESAPVELAPESGDAADLDFLSSAPGSVEPGPVVLESGPVDAPLIEEVPWSRLQGPAGGENDAPTVEPLYTADLDEISPEADVLPETEFPSAAQSEAVEPAPEEAAEAMATDLPPTPEPTTAAPPLTMAPRVEDVDLSAVRFGAEAWNPEATAEATDAQAEPTPLLDLAPADLVGDEEAAIEIPPRVEEVVEAPASAKPAKKPRAPRKKSGKSTTRAGKTNAADTGNDGSAASPTDASELPAATEAVAAAPTINAAIPPTDAAPAALMDDAPVPASEAEPVAAESVAPEPVEIEPVAAESVETTADEFAPSPAPQPDSFAADEEPSSWASADSSEPASKTSFEPVPLETAEPALQSMIEPAGDEHHEPVELIVPAEAQSASGAVLVETIGHTEPTLESALDLGDSLTSLQPASAASEVVDVDSTLTDTAFGRAVSDFTGSGLGPLVEERTTSSFAPRPTLHETDAVAADVAPSEPHSTDTDDSSLADAEWEAPASELSFDDSPASIDESRTLTGEFSLDQPIESDWSAAPPDLDFGTPETIESAPRSGLSTPDFKIDDSAPEAPLELNDLPADGSLAPLDEALNFDGDDEAAAHAPTIEPPAEPGPARDASSQPPAAMGETAAAPVRPVLDPYFGMKRDMGSFIGGMPLGLVTSVLQAPVVPPGKIAIRPAAEPPPKAPAAASMDNDDEEEALPAEEWLEEEPFPVAEAPPTAGADDDLFEGEEALELFDETADQLDALPDDLHPIDDVSGALASAPAPAAAPASKAPPLRSLTGFPAPAPGAPPVKVPPFAGTRSPRAGANPFAGLATPNLRGTDVFSQTAFPEADEALFQPQPVQDIPPTTIRSADGDQAAAPAPRAPWRPPAHASTPPAPPPVPGPAPRKSWWKNIRALLPLLALLIAAAAVVVIRFFPPPAVVQGTLRLKGLDNKDLSWAARKAQILNVRDLLAKPALREIVVQRLLAQGVSPGFVQNPAALAALADPENAPFDQKQQALALSRRTTDPQGDKARMAALLSVVYTDNLTSAEGAPGARQQATGAAARLQSLQTQLTGLQGSARKMSDAVTTATGASAQELLIDPAAAAQSLQSKETALAKTLADANAAVSRGQAALDQTEAASGAPGAAPDSHLMTMRQKLAALQARLGVIQVAQNGGADSGKAFDAALQTAADDLGLIVTTTRDPSISAYAATARQAAADIRGLIGRQRQNAQRAAELRTQLAAHRQTRLQQVWSSDETLKQMLNQRDEASGRVAASPDADAAAKARGVLDDLDQKIDARRQALITGGQDADELGQSLRQALDGVEQERVDNRLRINQDMALLDVPAVNRVPVADQGAITSLGEQIAGVKAAADDYARVDSSAASAIEQTRDLQNQTADQRAQLDAYEQRPTSSDTIVAARRVLAGYEQTEASAQKAYLSNFQLMASLRRLGDAQGQIADVTGQIAAAQSALQSARADAANIPVLVAPDDNSVQVASEPDMRVWYLVGAIGGLLILFAGPLWLALRESAPDAPMAMIVAEDRDLPAGRAHDNYRQSQIIGDDERTAVA